MKLHITSFALLLALGCAESKDGSGDNVDTGDAPITDYDDADGDGVELPTRGKRTKMVGGEEEP